MKGLFICVEGMDGCGKSSLIEALPNALQSKGLIKNNIVTTREPGGTAAAEAIRAFVLNPQNQLNDMTHALLMNAARSEHLDQLIRPALERGDLVLCDRFLLSTLVYQGARVPIRFLLDLHDQAQYSQTPDLQLILKAEPEVALERMRARKAACEQAGAADAMERHDLALITQRYQLYSECQQVLQKHYPGMVSVEIDTSDLTQIQVLDKACAIIEDLVHYS